MEETLNLAGTNALCTGCGTCASMCPNSAIKLLRDNNTAVYVRKINKTKCNHCGLCYRVCPGCSVDFPRLNLEVFGKKSHNLLLGNYLNCYMGYSKNSRIRYDSSSGGLVSQLLIFALDKKIVDGVLVTKMKQCSPLEPEPFIAKTSEEIILASKSKYCPVPANIAIKDLIRQEGKMAVVGLPCQIQGIRKAEVLNRKLKEKIILHVGLFCSHTVNFSGTELLLEKLKIKKNDVKQINYRGKGWPGHLSILLSSGRRILFKYSDYWRLFGPYFFTPLRCLCCYDLTNELADLSFGDAWLKEITNKDKEGTSLVVSRNKIGEDLLRKVELQGLVKLERIDAEKVVKSQYTALHYKKFGLSARMAILKSLGMMTPNYGTIRETINPLLYSVSLLQILDAIISQRKSAYNILKYTPILCLRIWGAFLYYLELLSIRSIGDRKYKYL